MVELGPGRGTLIRDVINTIRQFPFMDVKIDSIHLVEASPHLRQMQADLLKGTSILEEGQLKKLKTKRGNIEVVWHDTVDTVPLGPNLIISHEFFDALPVFKFEAR